MKPHWKLDIGTGSHSVAISKNGRTTAIGTDDGRILLVDSEGVLTGQSGPFAGRVFRLSITPDGERVAAGFIGLNTVVLLDSSGEIIWNKETGAQTWAGPCISHDGDLIVCGSDDGKVRMWNGSGYLLWEFQAGHSHVRPPSMTPDGTLITFGADDGNVYLLDQYGKLVWKYKTGGRVWSGSRIVPDGKRVAAGSSDGFVNYLAISGNLAWKCPLGAFVNTVITSNSGKYVVAGCANGRVSLIDASGEIVWSFGTDGSVYGVAVSDDESCIVCVSQDQCLRVFNLRGQVVFQQKTEDALYAAAVSSKGRIIVASGKRQYVYGFKDGSISGEEPAVCIPSRVHPMVLDRITRFFDENPLSGTCHLIDEFDKRLTRNHYDACLEMVHVIDQRVHEISGIMKVYLENRRGVFFLLKGIRNHEKRQFSEAVSCYRKSMEIQRHIGHAASEGQARVLLDLLMEEKRTGKRDTFLETIKEEIAVMGSVTTLLETILSENKGNAADTVLVLCLEFGLQGPVFKAFSSGDPVLKKKAAAVLSRFEQIKDRDAVFQLLHDPCAFIRSKIIQIIREQGWEMPSEHLLSFSSLESDPEVLRQIAFLTGSMKDPERTPFLLELLDDPDIEVKSAVIQALGESGDRTALSDLEHVDFGKDFLGMDLQVLSGKSRKRILERHPLPGAVSLKIFRIHRPCSPDRQLVQGNRFGIHDQLVFICRVKHARPNTGFFFKCRHEKKDILFEQEGCFSRIFFDTAPFLISLGLSPASSIQSMSDVTFVVPPPSGGFFRGPYFAEIFVKDESSHTNKSLSSIRFSIGNR